MTEGLHLTLKKRNKPKEAVHIDEDLLLLSPHDEEDKYYWDWAESSLITQFSHVTVKCNGKIEEEYFYRNGVLHRDDGPAVMKQSVVYGTTEEYYRHGQRHRKDGPAVIKQNSLSRLEEFYHDGKLDRKDGPAVIRQNSDFSTEEEYYRDGKLFRNNGPQVVKRYADGTTEEQYYENGEDDRPGPMHRFGGPAYIRRNADGSIQEERYYYGGVPRRAEFGPEVIKHNADGTSVREYCSNSITVKTEYLNSEGVIVKTEGHIPGEQCGKTYEVSLAEDKGLTGKNVSLKAVGPNRYSELKKATPQIGIASAPRAPQNPRAPGMAL